MDQTTTRPRSTAARHALGVLRHWRWVVFPAMAALALWGTLVGARELGERVGAAITTEALVVGEPVTVEIPGGASATLIAQILEQEGVVRSAAEFERRVRTLGVSSELKAGTYEMTTAMEADAAISLVVAGPPPVQVYDVRVIEGLELDDILRSLERQTPYTVAEFEAALLDGSVTSTLLVGPVAAITDWEGLLFPATYEIAEGDTPADILRRLASTMERRVASVDWSQVEALGYTRYDGIIVASLIEREARLDEDRPLIASVVYNRLEINQPLQIDATILYAIQEQTAAITQSDLDVDSPYNTYRNTGLPPTPIAAPGMASLLAAADPDDTNFFYYVLIDASGKHGFTETFDEFLVLKEQARQDGLLGP